MAIDPTISLGVRPPVIPPLQIQSPLEQFAKVLSLRNLMTENQSGQIGLQAQQMKMQEAQRQMDEQDRFTKWLHDKLAGAAPPATVAPLPNAGAPTPNAVAASPDTAAYTPVAPYTPIAGAPLRTLVPQAPATPVTPAAALPAMGGQDGFSKLNFGEILTNFPRVGPAFVKNEIERQKTLAEMETKQSERQEHYLRLIGQAGLASKNQGDRDFRIKLLVSAGAIPQDVGSQMLAQPFDLEATHEFGKQFVSYADQLKEKREAADQAFKETKQPFDLRTAMAGATSAEQKAAGTEPITPYQQQELDLSKYGKTAPYPQPVQAQKEAEAGALAGARTNVLLSPAKEAQEIRIAGGKAAASPNILDRESARFAKPHEKTVTDANAQLEKIGEARTMINGSATAQALGIPKVLSSLVGGAGSGLRMTKAELDAIAKARGISGDVEGFISKVSGEGVLTKDQQRQLTGLLDDVAGRIRQKQAIANEALDRINAAGSREEIVKIDSETRRKLGAGGAKTYSQADVDAAVAAHPGLTAAQADAAFAAKGWKKK